MDSDIFYKHKYDILVIVIMTFLFNYKFGLVCMILYILIYTLTNAKIKIYNEEKLINTSKKRCRPNSYDNPYGNFIFGSNPEIYDCDDSIIKDSNNQIMKIRKIKRLDQLTKDYAIFILCQLQLIQIIK